MASYLGSISLLEQLTELRETYYLLHYWFIITAYNSETARRKRWHRARYLGWGVELPCPLYGHMQLANQEALQTPPSCVFVEVSLYTRD